MLRRLLIAVAALAVLLAGTVYLLLSSDQVRVMLERQASDALGAPVRIGGARATIFPRAGLALTGVQIGAPAFLTLAHVDVSSEIVPLLSRRIEGAELRITDTVLALPLPPGLPLPGAPGPTPAPSSAPADAPGGSGAPVSLVSVHTIALENVQVRSLGRTVTISAEAGLDGTGLALSRFTATSGKTALSAKGQVTLGDAVQATLDATATALDLDDLIALVHAFGLDGGARSGSGGPPASLSLKLTSPVVRVAGLEASNLSAHVKAGGTGLAIDPLSLTLFDGRATGSIRLTVTERVSGQVRVAVTGLDAATLATWGGAKDTLSGRMNASGTFTGSGQDLGTLLATTRGTGQVEILDGALPGLEFPREALMALGRPKEQAPPPNGGRFDRIAAPFAVGGGRLTSEALSLTSRDVDVTAAGSLDLASDALDVRGTATLSETLTTLAGPGLTRVAGGGTRISLPATVAGTLSAPRVRLDAASLLKQTLRNEVKRNLLDRLTPLRDLTQPKPNRTF
ncbi:MAG: AsmA-like C-terminal region-containing protein [Vicinamibacterales bacterium]